MFRSLYFFLYLLSLALGALFSAKIKQMWRQRSNRSAFSKAEGPLPPPQAPIWIHAASGEFEYAKPLLSRLQQKNQTVVVSFLSPSFSKQVLSHPDIDYAEPLPFDLGGPVSAFLDRYKPKELWIARTDLWPEVLHQCRKRSIPVIVFSTSRPAPNFFKKLLNAIGLNPWNQVEHIFCVSDEDEANLRATGIKAAVSVIGDTRYDQVLTRLKTARELPLLAEWRESDKTPLLVAGSTWDEDHEPLLEACASALSNSQLKLLIAPHEPSPSHLETLRTTLAKRGLEFQNWSESDSWSTPVMILDRVGILAEAYSYADIAFVGGSFKAKVHSVMEPLAAGCPTLLGPYYSNNREAGDFMKLEVSPQLTMTHSSDDAKELKAQLERLLSSPISFAEIKLKIKGEVEARTGASDRLINERL